MKKRESEKSTLGMEDEQQQQQRRRRLVEEFDESMARLRKAQLRSDREYERLYERERREEEALVKEGLALTAAEFMENRLRFDGVVQEIVRARTDLCDADYLRLLVEHGWMLFSSVFDGHRTPAMFREAFRHGNVGTAYNITGHHYKDKKLRRIANRELFRCSKIERPWRNLYDGIRGPCSVTPYHDPAKLGFVDFHVLKRFVKENPFTLPGHREVIRLCVRYSTSEKEGEEDEEQRLDKYFLQLVNVAMQTEPFAFTRLHPTAQRAMPFWNQQKWLEAHINANWGLYAGEGFDTPLAMFRYYKRRGATKFLRTFGR